jgi:hypothetical protein
MQRYRFIFDLARLTTVSADEVNRSNLQGAVRNLELGEPASEDVLRILRRVMRFIQCFGYEHFLEDVTQDGGRAKGSLQAVMRGVRKHMKQCADVTKIVIVITDV